MKNKGIVLAVGMFFASMCMTMTAFAGNINIIITADTEKVEMDKEFNVEISMEADEGISEVDALLTYDPEILTFVSGDEQINGGDGSLTLKDKDESGGKTRVYSMTFKATEIGDTSITFSGEPTVLSESFEEMTYAFQQADISVEASKSASKNADLKSIKLNPGDWDEKFSKDTTTYSVTIPYSSDFISIDAKADDKEADVKVSGDTNLKEGWNDVVITVTAPAGNTKEYKLAVYRKFEGEAEEEEKIKEDNASATADPADLKSNEDMKITKKDDKVYVYNSFAYEIVELEDPSKIPAGFEESSISLMGEEITAYVSTQDTNNDFYLIYAANLDTGDTNFYQYDKVENTIQRYSGNIIPEIRDAVKVSMTDDEYQKRLGMCAVIIALLAALLAIVMVFAVKMFMKAQRIRVEESLD